MKDTKENNDFTQMFKMIKAKFKQRREREKGYILIYDRSGLPKNMTIKDVANEVQLNGKCYYDSSLSDIIPSIIHLGGEQHKELLDVVMVDISVKKP